MIKLYKLLRQHWRLTLAVTAAVLSLAGWLRVGPLPSGLLDDLAQPSTIVVDRNGERLFEARSSTGTRNEVLDANSLPPTLVAATLAVEDARFRWHPGVDPIAMARALFRDIGAGHIVEGGSTVTQQVAKMLVARRSGGRAKRNMTAKALEAVIALRLEHRMSKNEILALYLNLAPYGNQLEGAARAAQAYFGRDAASLTPAECAFLAALPQQPSRLNPWRDPERARPRQLRVLAKMHERGWLSAADLEAARAERISLNGAGEPLVAPHFVERVLAEVGEPRPRRIETTLDATLQRTVRGIIAQNRAALEQHGAHNVAVAVLDNRTGEWLAWEGSGDYFDAVHGGAIDGVVSPRQPGSALKPFTYAAAFERGVGPNHMLADVPSDFTTEVPGILYSPRNYDGQYRGPLLARAALAGSENVPAVALASEVGVPAIARLLRQAGVTTLDRNAGHYGLGLTLGNAEVRLDELIAAYAVFASGGEGGTPTKFSRVDGRLAPAPRRERVVAFRTAFWITDILSDASARAYVFGNGGSLEFPFTVAAKTGTSQAYHDNWAIGYTGEVTVGVWVGNFDRTPLRTSSGVTGAGPIFHDVMMAAVERARGPLAVFDDSPILRPPDDVHQIEVCAASGHVATDACPTRVVEWVANNQMPGACDWHIATEHGTATVYPEPLRIWAEKSARAMSDARPIAPPKPQSGALAIAQPLGGAVYLFDPTLRSEFQTLSLRAQGGKTGPLRWSIDGVPIATVEPHEAVRWPLVRGTHSVRVENVSGQSDSTTIVVR